MYRITDNTGVLSVSFSYLERLICDYVFSVALPLVTYWDHSVVANCLPRGNWRDVKFEVCLSVGDRSPLKLLNGFGRNFARG